MTVCLTMIAPLAKFIDWSALQFAAMLPSIRKCAGAIQN